MLIGNYTVPPRVQCSRGHIGVQQNVTVLEVLDVRASLKVLLEGVATFVCWREVMLD